jgi:hypothetical protein
MPNFTAYNVDVDLDIDVDDFLSECSKREIKEVINTLIEHGHLEKHPLIPGQYEKLGTMEKEFLNKLYTISTKYYSMSEMEIEMINYIYDKYR